MKLQPTIQQLFNFTKPNYMEWKEYKARITFINDFSLQQHVFSKGGELLEVF